MGTERTPARVPCLVWASLAALVMLVGCTSSQPGCSEQVDPDLLTRAERGVYKLFEDNLDQGNADAIRRTYEIRDARTCDDDLTFEYWPKSGIVGTVYSMTYDVTTVEVKVTGVD
jgi:hypothetical protein